jgi:hypothetical protein
MHNLREQMSPLLKEFQTANGRGNLIMANTILLKLFDILLLNYEKQAVQLAMMKAIATPQSENEDNAMLIEDILHFTKKIEDTVEYKQKELLEDSIIAYIEQTVPENEDDDVLDTEEEPEVEHNDNVEEVEVENKTNDEEAEEQQVPKPRGKPGRKPKA